MTDNYTRVGRKPIEVSDEDSTEKYPEPKARKQYSRPIGPQPATEKQKRQQEHPHATKAVETAKRVVKWVMTPKASDQATQHARSSRKTSSGRSRSRSSAGSQAPTSNPFESNNFGGGGFGNSPFDQSFGGSSKKWRPPF